MKSKRSKLRSVESNHKVEKKIRAPLRVPSSNFHAGSIEDEDQEIDRLEKLLGFKGKPNRKKVIEKIGKEFQEFEGIGEGDFGSFLESLDSISSYPVVPESETKDDQTVSEDELDPNPEESLEDENEDENEVPLNSPQTIPKNVYHPVVGEDIYGRSTAETAKYVPPARRTLLSHALDDSDRSLRLSRQMTGILNRLTDQSRDSLTRDLRDLFSSNPTISCCLALKQALFSICDNSSKMVSSLLPTYASSVAVLHSVVPGGDVAGILVEAIVRGICQPNPQTMTPQLASNMFTFLLQLYLYRVVDQGLVFDLLDCLLKGSTLLNPLSQSVPWVIGEEEISIVCSVVDVCGPQLRSDDQLRLKSLLGSITSLPDPSNDTSRKSFLLSKLSDFLTNKSKRNLEQTERLVSARRWIGSTRTSLAPSASSDPCLHVPLNDFLQADERGRWWRAGSFWKGRDQNKPVEETDCKTTHSVQEVMSSTKNIHEELKEEERELLRLADKLKLTTPNRKSVFLAVMGSSDVEEAFERVTRLGLKGKQDRDAALVLLECCGREKEYNPFYSEVLSLLCSQNRQYKTTTQYMLWDCFRLFEESSPSSPSKSEAKKQRLLLLRKSRNLGQLAGLLISRFHLPLSIIRPLDSDPLSPPSLSFISNLFITVFGSKVSDESFQLVLDRVAASADFQQVRSQIQTFLKTRFTSSLFISLGLSSETSSILSKRRERALKILASMEVLNFREDEDERDRGKKRKDFADDSNLLDSTFENFMQNIDPCIIVTTVGIREGVNFKIELAQRGFLLKSSIPREGFDEGAKSCIITISQLLYIKLAIQLDIKVQPFHLFHPKEKLKLISESIKILQRSKSLLLIDEIWIAHNKKFNQIESSRESIESTFNSKNIDEIEAYFGPQIATYFSWLQYYTSFLLIPTILGVLLFCHQFFIENNSIDSVWTGSYGIALVIWSTCFSEFWKRRNAEDAFRWGILGREEEIDETELECEFERVKRQSPLQPTASSITSNKSDPSPSSLSDLSTSPLSNPSPLSYSSPSPETLDPKEGSSEPLPLPPPSPFSDLHSLFSQIWFRAWQGVGVEARISLSLIVVVILCGLMVSMMLWFYRLQEQVLSVAQPRSPSISSILPYFLDLCFSLYPTLIYSLFPPVLLEIFKFISETLTRMEGHVIKADADFSYSSKVFSLQFVNCNIALFYCLYKGNLYRLRQMMVIQLIVSALFNNFYESYLPHMCSILQEKRTELEELRQVLWKRRHSRGIQEQEEANTHPSDIENEDFYDDQDLSQPITFLSFLVISFKYRFRAFLQHFLRLDEDTGQPVEGKINLEDRQCVHQSQSHPYSSIDWLSQLALSYEWMGLEEKLSESARVRTRALYEAEFKGKEHLLASEFLMTYKPTFIEPTFSSSASLPPSPLIDSFIPMSSSLEIPSPPYSSTHPIFIRWRKLLVIALDFQNWIKEQENISTSSSQPLYYIPACPNSNPSDHTSSQLPHSINWREILVHETSLQTYNDADDYLELLIQYGYVSIFSLIFPLAPLLAYLNNIFEGDVDLQKLLSSFRKPNIRQTASLGAWSYCLEFINFLSLLTNCYLICVLSSQLNAFIPPFSQFLQSISSSTANSTAATAPDLISVSVPTTTHLFYHLFTSAIFSNTDSSSTFSSYFSFSSTPSNSHSSSYFQEKLILMVALEHVLFLVKICISGVIQDVPVWIQHQLLLEQKNEEKRMFRERLELYFKEIEFLASQQSSEETPTTASNHPAEFDSRLLEQLLAKIKFELLSPSNPSTNSSDSGITSKTSNTSSLFTISSFNPSSLLYVLFLPIIFDLIGVNKWVYLPFSLFYLFYLQAKKDKDDRRTALGIVSDPSLMKSINLQLPLWFNESEVQRVEWLNSIISRLWPGISHSLSRTLHSSLSDVFEKIRLPLIPSISLEKFDLGSTSPKITGIKYYPSLGDSYQSVVRLDLELKWMTTNLFIQIMALQTPLELKDFRFSGTLRIELSGIRNSKSLPGFSSLSLTFLKRPDLDFSLTVASLDMMNLGISKWTLSRLVKEIVLEKLSGIILFPKKKVFHLNSTQPSSITAAALRAQEEAQRNFDSNSPSPTLSSSSPNSSSISPLITTTITRTTTISQTTTPIETAQLLRTSPTRSTTSTESATFTTPYTLPSLSEEERERILDECGEDRPPVGILTLKIKGCRNLQTPYLQLLGLSVGFGNSKVPLNQHLDYSQWDRLNFGVSPSKISMSLSLYSPLDSISNPQNHEDPNIQQAHTSSCFLSENPKWNKDEETFQFVIYDKNADRLVFNILDGSSPIGSCVFELNSLPDPTSPKLTPPMKKESSRSLINQSETRPEGADTLIEDPISTSISNSATIFCSIFSQSPLTSTESKDDGFTSVSLPLTNPTFRQQHPTNTMFVDFCYQYQPVRFKHKNPFPHLSPSDQDTIFEMVRRMREEVKDDLLLKKVFLSDSHSSSKLGDDWDNQIEDQLEKRDPLLHQTVDFESILNPVPQFEFHSHELSIQNESNPSCQVQSEPDWEEGSVHDHFSSWEDEAETCNVCDVLTYVKRIPRELRSLEENLEHITFSDTIHTAQREETLHPVDIPDIKPHRGLLIISELKLLSFYPFKILGYSLLDIRFAFTLEGLMKSPSDSLTQQQRLLHETEPFPSSEKLDFGEKKYFSVVEICEEEAYLRVDLIGCFFKTLDQRLGTFKLKISELLSDSPHSKPLLFPESENGYLLEDCEKECYVQFKLTFWHNQH